MFEVIMVAIVWIVAIIGIHIMKKIQPDDKLYPAYAIAICILLTTFVAWHESWGLVFLKWLQQHSYRI